MFCFTAIRVSLKGSFLSLCLFLLCLIVQECFNPLTEIDLVPEGPKHIPPYVSRNQSPLGELLLGFLEYYATHFRYLPWILHSQVFGNPPMGPWPACFSLPFLILPRFSSQPVTPLLALLSCFFYSCFMFLAEGQEQLGTLALPIRNKKYHRPSGCRVCLLGAP